MGKSKNTGPINSVAISTNLDKAGIIAELNQNDVVELIAQTKYNSIMDEIHELNENVKRIYDTKIKYQDEQKIAFVQQLIDSGIVKEENRKALKFSNSYLGYGASDKTAKPQNCVFGKIVFNEASRKREICTQALEFGLLDESCFLSLTYHFVESYSGITEKHGVEVNTHSKRECYFSKKEPVPRSFIETFNKSLIEHCQRVEDFYLQHKGFTIDIDRLIREIRVKFNKELLKAKSPAVNEQINHLFQVTL